MTRPTWDKHFMNLATITAEMSTCPRASVGCVLVRDKHLLATGHNGSACGLPHCIDVGCIMRDGHCIAAIHAEQNAIIQAAKHGVSTIGCTAFVTHYPCCHCSKILINAGIQRVVYSIEYPDKHSDLFFYQAKIQVERIQL